MKISKLATVIFLLFSGATMAQQGNTVENYKNDLMTTNDY